MKQQRMTLQSKLVGALSFSQLSREYDAKKAAKADAATLAVLRQKLVEPVLVTNAQTFDPAETWLEKVCKINDDIAAFAKASTRAGASGLPEKIRDRVTATMPAAASPGPGDFFKR